MTGDDPAKILTRRLRQRGDLRVEPRTKNRERPFDRLGPRAHAIEHLPIELRIAPALELPCDLLEGQLGPGHGAQHRDLPGLLNASPVIFARRHRNQHTIWQY